MSEEEEIIVDREVVQALDDEKVEDLAITVSIAILIIATFAIPVALFDSFLAHLPAVIFILAVIIALIRAAVRLSLPEESVES